MALMEMSRNLWQESGRWTNWNQEYKRLIKHSVSDFCKNSCLKAEKSVLRKAFFPNLFMYFMNHYVQCWISTFSSRRNIFEILNRFPAIDKLA